MRARNAALREQLEATRSEASALRVARQTAALEPGQAQLHALRRRVGELTEELERKAADSAAAHARVDRVLSMHSRQSSRLALESKGKAEALNRAAELEATSAGLGARARQLEAQLEQSRKREAEVRAAAEDATALAQAAATDLAEAREYGDGLARAAAAAAEDRACRDPRHADLAAENARLRSRCRDATRELGALDGKFFDEVEELKFKHARALQLNAGYERALRALCTSSGVAFGDVAPPEWLRRAAE